MCGKYLLAIIIALFMVFPGALTAQEEADYEDVLDILVVTASRALERVRDVSQSIEVVTPMELQNTTAKDLSDILSSHGIQINYDDSRNYGNASVTMRGFSSSNHGNDLFSGVLILINGRRVGMDTITLFTLDNIERVEVIRGPGSMQYGAAGLGGVINIITKRGDIHPEGKIEVGMGSDDEFKTNIFGSGKIGRLDLSGSFGYRTEGDFSDASGDKHPDSGVNAFTTYSVNLGWNFNELHRLGFFVMGSAVDRGGNEGIGNDTRGLDYFKGRYYEGYQNKRLDTGELIYEGSTESGTFDWMGRYFYGKSQYKLYRQYPGLSALGYPEDYNTSTNKFVNQGSQAQISYNGDMIHLTGGIDWLRYAMSQTQFKMPYSSTDGRSSSDSVFSNFGAFLLGRINLLEDRNLVITGGLRYDSFDINIDSTVKEVPQEKQNRKYNKTLPSIGIAYSPIDELKLRINYAWAYHVPTPRELIGNFYMMASLFKGNTELEPQESKSLDFGFDFQWQGLLASASYYTTQFDNYIASERLQNDPVYTYQYINIKDVTINGFETSLKFELGQWFDWDFDISPYIYYGRILKYETKTGTKIPGINEITFATGLSFDYPSWGLSASLSGSYKDVTKAQAFSNQTPYDRTIGIGGAMVWDLSLSKDLYDFGEKGKLKIKVSADNIFNKYYDVGENEYPSGRTFYVGLVYDL
jgi:vitamin B12 transporter